MKQLPDSFTAVTKLNRRAKADAPSPHRYFGDKVVAHELAGELGLRRAALLAVAEHATRISLPKPQSLVLKPRFGVGGFGVHVLDWTGESYVDRRRGVATSLEDVLAKAAMVAEQKGTRYLPYLAEEQLKDASGSRHLVDYKMYTFFGRAVVMLVKYNHPTRYGWIGRDGSPIDTGKYLDRKIPFDFVPDNVEDLFQLAEDIGSKLPIAFCRIDLYNTTRGIYFGEITPAPGTPSDFSASFDAFLCASYRDAVLRLRSAVEGGELDLGLMPDYSTLHI